jgi:hypothetical protein
MDFTLKIYKELIQAIRSADYEFQTFEQYLTNPLQRAVILRNDVDRKPARALRLAEILSGLDIKATFYFRMVKSSWDELIMAEIVHLGHELGYHYEDLTTAKGDSKLAIKSFENNLAMFRQYYPVKTICMHGSPLSRWDNRSLWTEFNYRDYGISGEPYLDLDFSQVLYLTDSGRCWNGGNTIVRDKVSSKFNFNLKSTFDLIIALKQNILPEKIMLTVHPQRWTDNLLSWPAELLTQNAKNIIKKYFIVRRGHAV